MRDYFYGKFPKQLRQLELRPANTVLRENVGELRCVISNALYEGRAIAVMANDGMEP